MGKQWRTLWAVGCVGAAVIVVPASVQAAPERRAGHVGLAWTVTDAAGSPPPNSFGAGGHGMWAGADRIWNQPGFTGSYRITVDGAPAAGYCGDFHNARSPDANSVWVDDRAAFLGSDKALTKLSYAQWRWGATVDPNVGAALNLYTHFLGSPGDRSNSGGVPIPDINDNDILDEVVTTLAPHAAVAQIMYDMDAASEAWSASFDHTSANIAAGVAIEMSAGDPIVVAAATGRQLPEPAADVTTSGRNVTATTAGLGRPLRDSTAGSQNSMTSGAPQQAELFIAPDIAISSQISEDRPSIGSTLTDAIVIGGLLDGETATVSVELFDLTVDPAGEGTPLASETRTGLRNGTTTLWTPFETTAVVAAHSVGYRHRIDSMSLGAFVAPNSQTGMPTEWSELGIASETGAVDAVDATVHLRKTLSSSSAPGWVNAQREAMPTHDAAPASEVAADGPHDDQVAGPGDGLPLFVAGDSISFRYEIWLADSSTGDVAWSTTPDGMAPAGMIVDDNGTQTDGDDGVSDDFSPMYVSGDNGDGRLSVGEVWILAALEQRLASPGEQYRNTATVVPGDIVNPVTGAPAGRTTAPRVDPAGYVVPCLATSIADPEDGDRLLDHSGGAMVDTATFCNLVPGEQYVIDGVVVHGETGELTELGGTSTFTPDAPSGTVDVEIVIAGAIDPGDYVVFETIRLASGGAVVAVHADLADEAQTFTVVSTPEPEPAPEPPSVQETPPVVHNPPPPSLPPAPQPPIPSIPKVGSGWEQLAAVIGLALLTAGVVLMEARHGRLKPRNLGA